MDKRLKDYPEAIKLYQTGLSVQDVADFYGITRQAMWTWLRRRGIKMRPQKRTQQANHFYRGGCRSHKKAIGIVERAIKKGLIERPQICQECSTTCAPVNNRPQIEAHHDDYNHPLNVRWLCRKCHFQWHKTNQAIPYS
jgi:transposase-like protein